MPPTRLRESITDSRNHRAGWKALPDSLPVSASSPSSAELRLFFASCTPPDLPPTTGGSAGNCYFFLPRSFTYAASFAPSSLDMPLLAKECEAFFSLPPFNMKSSISAVELF